MCSLIKLDLIIFNLRQHLLQLLITVIDLWYPTTEMPIDIFRTQNISFRNVVINRLHIWVEDFFFNGPRVIKQRRGEYE